MAIRSFCAGLAALSFLVGGNALAQPAAKSVTAGALTAEPATFIALAFDWSIEGDANRNAVAAVDYREVGGKVWRKGMPLFRLQDEKIRVPLGAPMPRPETADLYFVARNGFSGSIFDLEPGTEYEVRFTLTDPDGVSGKVVRTLRARTRTEPTPAAGGRVFHVYPKGFKGPKLEPSYESLLSAYYLQTSQSDHAYAFPPRVRPGDTILVHAGVYKDSRTYYGGFDRDEPTYGTVFDGTYYLTEKGTEARPIVIKGAGDGEVIFDGGGNAVLFDVSAGDYNYFEGITVRNTEVGFLLGRKRIAGSSGFTLKRSRIENVGRGVHGDWAGARNITIVDNVFVGRHPSGKMMGWTRFPWKTYPGYPSPISGPGGSEYAVKIYGQGNVVAYNRISGFHDGINNATYGLPEKDPAQWAMAIDIYNNHITNMDDNCVEGDGAVRNIRIMRNLCFNSAQAGISFQPLFGGPGYLIRNVMFNNISGSLKFTDTGAGAFVANNTIIGEVRNWWPFGNQHYANNLFLAQGAIGLRSDKDPPAPVFDVSTNTTYDTSDYNGFSPWPTTQTNFQWNVTKWGEKEGPARGWHTLSEYSKATGQDQHSILIGYDVFQKASPPDMKDITTLYDPAYYDLRLNSKSAAVDAGKVLPGITDGYAGKAPDLGAYEDGQAVPHYGPRP